MSGQVNLNNKETMKMSEIKNKLCLHAGAALVDRDAVNAVATPEPTISVKNRLWQPVAHGAVIDAVENSILGSGLSIADRAFALTKGGSRLFGLITLGSDQPDYAVTIGLRNSHDKTFPVGLALGSRVFVCDNLAFSSDVNIASKHTRYIYDRLPRLVADGVAQLVSHRANQHRRIEAYKDLEIRGQAHLHDLVLRAYRAQAIPAQAIPRVIEEFEEPRHPEFVAATGWSLFNAVTETLKDYGDLQRRTQRLHGVIDAEVGTKLLAV
jgi:hypothetical protein